MCWHVGAGDTYQVAGMLGTQQFDTLDSSRWMSTSSSLSSSRFTSVSSLPAGRQQNAILEGGCHTDAS